MTEFAAALGLLVISGVVATISRDRFGVAQMAGQIGAISGSVLGLVTAIRVLVTGEAEAMSGILHMPGGTLHIEIDALSAFFLLPVFGLSILTALYGRSYLAARGRGAAAA